MRIEHWAARSTSPALQLVWNNLLGVCAGDVGGDAPPKEREHCDRRRGNAPLHVNPASFPPDAATLFQYNATTGEVFPRSTLSMQQQQRVAQTIQQLNLNVPRLKRNRKEIIQALRRRIQNGKFGPAQLRRWIGEQR